MYKKDSDCIVTISLETEKKNLDSLNHCFDKILLEYIEKLENDTELKGIIITSTEDSFLAKYDIENLFDLKKRYKAKVMSDGSIYCNKIQGSIHKVGAEIQGMPSCNGWSYWHFNIEGKLEPIDK